MRITPPRNLFALAQAPRHMLIAGGIGVTPIIAMAHALAAWDEDFVLHYCAHNRATAPFLAELEAGPFGNRLEVHLSGDREAPRFDPHAVLEAEPAPLTSMSAGRCACRRASRRRRPISAGT